MSLIDETLKKNRSQWGLKNKPPPEPPPLPAAAPTAAPEPAAPRGSAKRVIFTILFFVLLATLGALLLNRMGWLSWPPATGGASPAASAEENFLSRIVASGMALVMRPPPASEAPPAVPLPAPASAPPPADAAAGDSEKPSETPSPPTAASPAAPQRAVSPRAPAPPPRETVVWPFLQLTGVIGGASGRGAARLNGVLVVVGEEIDGVRLESVSAAGAVLSYKGERRMLRVGGSSQ